MLNLLFNTPQNYAWALNYGRRLLEDETKDVEKNRTEHQINTRIYNNAFCGLLRTGYPFETIPVNNQTFLRLVIDNITFQCPSNTVSNILRQEYDTLVKPKVDACIQMESDKAPQPENAEQITAASGQGAEPVQTPGTKPGEEAAPDAEPVPDEKTDSITESVPAAEVSQKENPSAHRGPSPLKAGDSPDELPAKVTPQKQMEMMRDLKKQRTLSAPKEAGEKGGKSAAKENPVPKHAALDRGKGNGEVGEKEKKERPFHHPTMVAPNLDDIIFAPVTKNKKVVEIGEGSVKTLSGLERSKQDEECTAMETEAGPQAPDVPVSTVEGKQESNSHPSAEIATDDAKTEYKPEPVDSENPQSEPAANDVPSASHLEFEALLDRADEGTTSDQQKDLKEQQPVHQGQESDIQPQEKAEDNRGLATLTASEQPSKRLFQPRSQRFAPKTASSTDVSSAANPEGLTGQISPKEKKRFLSALFGEKKKETETIAPALNPALPEKEEGEAGEADAPATVGKYAPAQTDHKPAEVLKSSVQAKEEYPAAPENVKTESYNHDGGKIFSHIHQVALKKQFGNSSTGPYRFIFWPLRIIEMQSKKTWADFLVHVTDQNGNETLLCTDGVYKELIVKVDGKEFNVYATWTNGVFDSHVSLHGKTASIFTIEEEVYKEEPEDAEHDSFLDQFRLERKGQPKHFIVPFKNNNRGELNIPIVGCVELGGKRYPLERREENTLRYRYNGSDKIIRGHWEKGVFQFSVDDANRFIWEGQNE